MASSTALYTGLSGLLANSRSLDVIGDNIANSNTIGFKSSRMIFADQFSRDLSNGTAPGTNTGGTNPLQIGLGVVVAGTQRDFTTGSLTTTGDQRDLAIDGNGFFVVKRGNQNLYTRDGSFRTNSANDLVSASGEKVQGFTVDSNFNVVPGLVSDINIPVGSLTLAQATKNVRISGNLNTSGTVASQGSQTVFNPLGVKTGVTTSGGAVDPTTKLVDLAGSGGPSTSLFTAGQTIVVSGATRGTGTVLPDESYTVTSGSTVSDMLNFFNRALAVDTTNANPDGITPGAVLNPTTGVITVNGEAGSANDLDLSSGTIKVLDSAGVPLSGNPFTTTKAKSSDGESVRALLQVYDSLGSPVTINATLVLEQLTGGSGSTWRYYADSPDVPAGTSPIIGSGTLQFDQFGQIKNGSTFSVDVDRTGTGAESPMNVTIDLKSTAGNLPAGNVTALSQASNLAMTYQDGQGIGTLQSYSIGNDGIITGAFSNGLTRTLGQVAVATFANNEGLVSVGSNEYQTGPNSGAAVIGQALQLGAGKIVGGSLEQSNTELSQEFINLIQASTGFNAASRVITTTNELMQQLLQIGR